jgi:plastocyanin
METRAAVRQLRFLRFLIGGLIAAVVIPGCGGSGTGTSSGGDAVGGPGEVVAVIAVDNSFREEQLTVRAGTTVEWTNRGRSNHDIVPVDGPDGWGIDLEQFASGAIYSHTFTETGTYAYYCTVHGTKTAGMIGVVTVE